MVEPKPDKEGSLLGDRPAERPESIHATVGQRGVLAPRQKEEGFCTAGQTSTGRQSLRGVKRAPCMDGGGGANGTFVNADN